MIALDTGFLLAAEGLRGASRWMAARRALDHMAASDLILPSQALAELLHVLQLNGRHTADAAGVIVARWLAAGRSADIGPRTIQSAQALARDTNVPLEDALILASAEAAGAQFLLTEDIAEGAVAATGITIINPFTPQGEQALDGLFARDLRAG